MTHSVKAWQEEDSHAIALSAILRAAKARAGHHSRCDRARVP